MESVTASKGHSDPDFVDTQVTPSTTSPADHAMNSTRNADADDRAQPPHVQQQTLTYPTPDSEPTISVSLTHEPLSLLTVSKFIASPASGANVFFTGTTRDTFGGRTVTRLEYSSYPALALKTMLNLCQTVQENHKLDKVYLVHRLGVVAVGEESIIIGVSSPHRKAAWEGGEELLELVKAKVEVWKREWFLDGAVFEGRDGAIGKQTQGPVSSDKAVERGEWRANAERDNQGNLI